MRNIFFIFLFLLISCNPALLTKQDKEQVFTHETSFTSKELRQKIKIFVLEKFISGKAVIQTDDQNMISGNGIIPYSGENYFYDGQMLITFIAKFYPSEYKIKFILKRFETSSGKIQDVTESYKSKFVMNLKKSFAIFDKELFDYINNKSEEF